MSGGSSVCLWSFTVHPALPPPRLHVFLRILFPKSLPPPFSSTFVVHFFYHILSLVGVADHKGGVALLSLSLFLRLAFNNVSRRLAVDVGGEKRLHALSTLGKSKMAGRRDYMHSPLWVSIEMSHGRLLQSVSFFLSFFLSLFLSLFLSIFLSFYFPPYLSVSPFLFILLSFFLSAFLVADTRLFTLPCRSVRPSVRPSVCHISKFGAVFA